MPVDGSAVGTLCFVFINPSFLPSALSPTPSHAVSRCSGPTRGSSRSGYR
jgi:hypothetical protein